MTELVTELASPTHLIALGPPTHYRPGSLTETVQP